MAFFSTLGLKFRKSQLLKMTILKAMATTLPKDPAKAFSIFSQDQGISP